MWPLFKTALGQADDMCCVHAASQSHMNGDGGGVAAALAITLRGLQGQLTELVEQEGAAAAVAEQHAVARRHLW